MSKEGRAKKEEYFTKLYAYLEEYKSIFIVRVDNVGSNQMHQIRKSLRGGKGVVLMGKNTMVRRALRNKMADHPEWERLLSVVVGNIGFVFTNQDLKEIRGLVLTNRIQAPAKAGALAPNDVTIPAGNTGMEPGKTSFFQALGVPTKIARGTIEIVSDVALIKAGSKVGASEAALLNMLNISPFTYGMTIECIYDDGVIFAPAILDITEESLLKKFMSGVTEIAALSLALDYPTVASVPHSIANGYKNVLASGLAMEDYGFAAIDKLREMLADPSKFAVAAPAASAPSPKKEAKAVAKKEEEPKEESDDDMGFGLFD